MEQNSKVEILIEKEEYEKPSIEIISLLKVDIITESPFEEEDVDVDDDPEEEDIDIDNPEEEDVDIDDPEEDDVDTNDFFGHFFD